jgi:hypothetical protein
MMNQSIRAYEKFVVEESSLELFRLQDNEYCILREYSFPLREDGFVILDLRLADRRNDRRLLLSKVLVALEENFGPSSRNIDFYKQTFSFPFLLRFTKGEESWSYLLRLDDFRGSLEFNFYRVVDSLKYAETRRDAYNEPIEGELGKEEMKYWISYLWGYLKTSSEVWCRYKIRCGELAPFFRHVDSNHILYGYLDGEFFEYQIQNEKKYKAKVAKLRQKYGDPEPSLDEQIEVTQAFVQAICQTASLTL